MKKSPVIKPLGMKIILTTITILLITKGILAQIDSNASGYLKLAPLIGPGIGYEMKIKDNISWDNHLILLPWKIWGGADVKPFVEFYTPEWVSMLKYYHNFDRRQAKGKRTEGFHGNYFGLNLHLPSHYFTDNENPIDSQINSSPALSIKFVSYIFIGGVYGIQRPIGKNWYFDAQIGQGIKIVNKGVGTKYVGFPPYLFFSLGYKFPLPGNNKPGSD